MEIVRHHFSIIDSTNTWAKLSAHQLDHAKLHLITADEQTGGRGRFNRVWVSPAGLNIYATYCFFIEKHSQRLGNVPQILGISAARTLENMGFKPKLKWPNDVLLSHKKVAGILCESTPYSDLLCIVAGIGLNVNMPIEMLEKIDRPATSLLVESGQSYVVEDVLAQLSDQFSKDLDLFLEEGFHHFLAEYKQRIMTFPGQAIRFHDNRTVWEGQIHSINNDGSLNLQLADGTIKHFIAGEIL